MSLFCSYRCSLLFITERDWFVLTKVMEFVCGMKYFQECLVEFIYSDSDETNENEADYWSETVVLTPLSSNGFQSEIDHRFPPVGTIVNNEPQGSFYNLLNNDQSYGKCIFEILTTTNLFSAIPDPEQLYQDSFIVIPEQHGHLPGNPVNLGYDALPQYSQYPPQQEQIQVKRSTTTSRKTRKSKEKRTASINYGQYSALFIFETFLLL